MFDSRLVVSFDTSRRIIVSEAADSRLDSGAFMAVLSKMYHIAARRRPCGASAPAKPSNESDVIAIGGSRVARRRGGQRVAVADRGSGANRSLRRCGRGHAVD